MIQMQTTLDVADNTGAMDKTDLYAIHGGVKRLSTSAGAPSATGRFDRGEGAHVVTTKEPFKTLSLIMLIEDPFKGKCVALIVTIPVWSYSSESTR